MTEPYDDLTKLAVGTPCQLTKLDTRALYRLSEWMKAYCKTRRNGAMPPPGETAAAAYYMVSFFIGLLSNSKHQPFALDSVNRCFDKVMPHASLLHCVKHSCFIACNTADCRQYAARH
jgi:hypothetical protein